jgi:ubiquinone/menaquinone biosynthesis C-methylase UbiE
MQLPDSAILNNLYVPGFTRPDNVFEKKYIACRSKENRVYTDEEVLQFPDCRPSHPHYHEWLLRKAAFKKLYSYLEQQNRSLSILDIGCGNGWCTHRLTGISRTRVTGIDINFTELQQAARVFNNIHKAKFVYGDIRSGILDDRQFDIILFSASIQYFKSLDSILELCLQHLKPRGEIHIMDTRFYQPKEKEAARKRTEHYYHSIGMPEMSDYYFHHSLHAFAQFRHSILYDPSSFMNRFIRNHPPFHWIRIVNDE